MQFKPSAHSRHTHSPLLALSMLWALGSIEMDLGAVIMHVGLAGCPKVKEGERKETAVKVSAAAPKWAAAQPLLTPCPTGCLFSSFSNPPLPLCFISSFSETYEKGKTTKTSTWFPFRSPNFRSCGYTKSEVQLKIKSLKTPHTQKPFQQHKRQADSPAPRKTALIIMLLWRSKSQALEWVYWNMCQWNQVKDNMERQGSLW